ncbi:L,D-transpeptidase [Kaistia sp. 32K]|uniref:L,D-transpeptidase n=1 Tax=Kaistia sp. 32K TaxID=2795690 RepID=UPI001915D0E1|nr:L,D-transpeptidase [Kaistia sp. 32K]BCP51449.1 L,D-transpeptidase [Kaistia sp. 32K]
MSLSSHPSRRNFVALALLLPVVTACATTGPVAEAPPRLDPATVSRYAAIDDDKFPIPAVDLKRLQTRNMRQVVKDPTGEQPGTIVVDPHNRFLYLVQEDGQALRYGVGVGKAGLEFTGSATVQYKRQWPRWTPTQDMIKRDPERNAKWAGGMEGGPENPLGARALYLFKNGQDTLYRIHGTNQPWSIGQAVSSGCIRMMNQDILDLYNRVPSGSKVVVLDSPESQREMAQLPPANI